MNQITVTALPTPEAISALTDQLMVFLKLKQVDARATHHVALVVEEVMTNLGTHGNCRDKPAKITVTIEPRQVKGEIVDSGPAFDPRSAPPPHLDALPDERAVGGLGLHLVRELSSTLEYAHRKDENYMTFTIDRS